MGLTISILGCGWLGLPLASRLVFQGFSVRGSVTRLEKMPLLVQQGIEPYHIEFNPDLKGQANGFFTSPIAVITIPFHRQLPDPSFYYQQIHAALGHFKQAKRDPWIVFTSSISVYPNDNGHWNETCAILSDEPRVKALRDVEDLILKHQGTVLRLGGLYGPGRELHRFFLKPALLKTAQGTMNVIHRDDVLGVMEAVIAKQVRGEIFNVVSCSHPTRFELYSHLAKKFGVPMPDFDATARNAAGKIVSNEKIKRVLEYRFVHPNPMEDEAILPSGDNP